jgi:hypothetical protein
MYGNSGLIPVEYREENTVRHTIVSTAEESIDHLSFKKFKTLVDEAEEIYDGLKVDDNDNVERSAVLEHILKQADAERKWSFNHTGYDEVYGRFNDISLKYNIPKSVSTVAKKSIRRQYDMPWLNKTKTKKEPGLEDGIFTMGPPMHRRPKFITHAITKVVKR